MYTPPAEPSPAALVWAGLMTGLHSPVLRFMRVDAQSEHFLSPPAVRRNAHDLKTCGRLSFCVRRSYDANERSCTLTVMLCGVQGKRRCDSGGPRTI